MSSKKEYEMLFQLNANVGSGFTGTFSKAQQQLLSMQKEIEALNRTQSDISAYQKQQQAVESTKNKLSVLQQQYDNIQKEIKETEGYSSSLENKLLAKQQQIDKTSASLERETEKLDQMGNALNEAGIDTSNLASKSEELSAKVAELKGKQEQAAQESQNFGNKAVSAFEAVGSALVAAGIAQGLKEIFNEYKECVSIAAEFEETMSTVEALSGANADELSSLSSMAKELGATTKFTAVESAEAMTYMAMAGWDANQMLSGMDGVLQLAAASGEDLAMVSDIVTDNLTAFGLKASDTAHFSDVLAAAATNSNTSVSIMGETFKNCAALAGALDYSVEDVAVAVGLMANAGIKGSNAGTALKNVFNGLLSGITLTSEAFGEVEYSAINADGTMKSFGETINDLRGYFSQMTGAEQLHNAEAIAGQRAMAGFVSILNSTDADFNKLTSSINDCSGAASKMAQIKLDNLNGQVTLMNSAADALKTTIGEQFKPELQGLAKIATEGFTLLQKFAQQNPVITKTIMLMAAAAVALTTAYSAYVAVKKIASALELKALAAKVASTVQSWAHTTALGAETGATGILTTAQMALNAAMMANPIGFIIGAVALLTAGAVALVEVIKNTEDETAGMTATTRDQYYALQDLNAEYEAACEEYGETSEEATKLRGDVEALRLEYEASQQSLDELVAECDSLVQSHNDLIQSYNETKTSANNEELGTLGLISKLQTLGTVTDKTASQQKQLELIAGKLAETYPELGISAKDLTTNSAKYVDVLKATCKAEAEKQKLQNQSDTYTEALKQQMQLEEEIAKVEANLAKEREAEGYYWDEQMQEYTNGVAVEGSPWANWTTDLDTYNDKLAELNSAYEENASVIKEIEEAWDASADAANEASTAEEAVKVAYESVKSELEDLCIAYDEAYNAAIESFEGQFGLFDTAKADMEATVSAAQQALDSQLQYWSTYTDNINVLKGQSYESLGVTQENYNALMSFVQSGTEEAAGLAQSMVNAINSGNTEAVAKLANTVGAVEQKKAEAASAIANWQTDFNTKMDAIVQKAQTSIEDMDLSDEATTSAQATISAYAESIKANQDGAVKAANEVAAAVTRALESAHPTITVNVKQVGGTGGGGGKYASGTDNARKGVALVGELGPELVYFGGGETVIPADETASILKYYGSDMTGYASGTDNADEIIQIVSFLPLMQNFIEAMRGYNETSMYEPVSAESSNYSSVNITIAPTFTVNGTADGNIEDKLREFSEIVVSEVMEALDEAGIDAKRGVYV